MRGEDLQQHELFSYGSLEERIPADHPLRPIRAMVDEALKQLSGRFDDIYGEDGRRSIPPERLLRALLIQLLYTVRSERMLMEQLEYNLLFRWFCCTIPICIVSPQVVGCLRTAPDGSPAGRDSSYRSACSPGCSAGCFWRS